eukprot:5406716-Pleurochrysis_carterae.AAC.3
MRSCICAGASFLACERGRMRAWSHASLRGGQTSMRADANVKQEGLLILCLFLLLPSHLPLNPPANSAKTMRAPRQIYNEAISDLISDGADGARSPLAVREDPRNGIYVEGLSEFQAKAGAALAVLRNAYPTYPPACRSIA